MSRWSDTLAFARSLPGLLGMSAVVGCALPQPEVCATWVECQRAVDASVDTSAWERGGSCWSLPSTARDCEAQCAAALDALRALPDAPSVCGTDTAEAPAESSTSNSVDDDVERVGDPDAGAGDDGITDAGPKPGSAP